MLSIRNEAYALKSGKVISTQNHNYMNCVDTRHLLKGYPACRRLLFSLLHAEKGQTSLSAWSKGNWRRLRAGCQRAIFPPVYAGSVKRIQSRDTKFLASGSTDGPHVYPGGDTLGMLSRDMPLGLKNLTLYQTTFSCILQPLLPTLSQTRQNFYSRLNSSYH